MMEAISSRSVNPQVAQAIEHILRNRLGDSGYERSDIRGDRDQDGDPILLVDVIYRPIARPLNSKATFGLVTAIRAELAQLGESRFPLIRHHFDAAQKIAS